MKKPKRRATKSPPTKRQRLFGPQFRKHWNEDEVEKLGERMWVWFQAHGSRYLLKSFCLVEMFHPKLLSAFAKRNEYFAYLLSLCKVVQEQRLVEKGMDKNNGQAMPIFALKNVAGWRDEVEQDDDDSTLTEVAEVFGKMVSSAGAGVTTRRDQPLQDGTQALQGDPRGEKIVQDGDRKEDTRG